MRNASAVTLAGMLAAVCCTLHGQPRFEVASVRMNRIAACSGRWDLRVVHGTLTAENAPLRRIISRAYQLTDDRVSGPAWLDSTCYDITAKASGDLPEKQLMPMLQALLVERFHLVARRESEERPVLALVVDRDGPKLKRFGAKVSAPIPANARPILFAVRHIPDLCERLAVVTGRSVVDETRLTGDYQIELTYVPAEALTTDPADSQFEISSAIRTQLGLRLDARRAPIEILKIQSIDKVPTEN